MQYTKFNAVKNGMQAYGIGENNEINIIELQVKPISAKKRLR